ncbi:hypothetical protein GQX74_003490 [Glossina fuscipes]|nr:hypothetical protein GQX74_003490 [Glossina fuscipes]
MCSGHGLWTLPAEVDAFVCQFVCMRLLLITHIERVSDLICIVTFADCHQELIDWFGLTSDSCLFPKLSFHYKNLSRCRADCCPFPDLLFLVSNSRSSLSSAYNLFMAVTIFYVKFCIENVYNHPQMKQFLLKFNKVKHE